MTEQPNDATETNVGSYLQIVDAVTELTIRSAAQAVEMQTAAIGSFLKAPLHAFAAFGLPNYFAPTQPDQTERLRDGLHSTTEQLVRMAQRMNHDAVEMQRRMRRIFGWQWSSAAQTDSATGRAESLSHLRHSLPLAMSGHDISQAQALQLRGAVLTKHA